jgi:hypothetical protein
MNEHFNLFYWNKHPAVSGLGPMTNDVFKKVKTIDILNNC